MHRIDSANNSNGLFVAGTVVSSDWLNAVQEEIAAVIESYGGTLSKTNRKQLASLLLLRASDKFDLIIDSNEALARWAACIDGSYKSVLIMPGTWVSTSTVDLAAAGTVRVIGLPGSILAFNLAAASTDELGAPTKGCVGLLGNLNQPTALIKGVTITVTNSVGVPCGFSKCVNLQDCKVTATALVDQIYARAYHDCQTLINCKAYASSTATTNGSANCFSYCKDIYNCYGYIGRVSTAGEVFAVCSNIYGSTGKFDVTIYPEGNGFFNCRNIHGCIGIGKQAFMYCSRVVGCQGIGIGSAGVGFLGGGSILNSLCFGTSAAMAGCKNVMLCQFSTATITVDSVSYTGVSTLENCFADSSSAHVCADTAEGGYNSASQEEPVL